MPESDQRGERSVPLTSDPKIIRRAVARQHLARACFRHRVVNMNCHHTFFTSRDISKFAVRAGFVAEAHKYHNSPIDARARRLPLPRLWQWLLRYMAFDYLLLRAPK